MPALTNVAHFLNLVVDAPEAFGWPTFQALTGIEVLPFSENTTAADISFPKDDFAAAVAFCRVYKTYETSEARAKYLAAKDDEHNDGRKAIKLWVMTSWKEWQISERVAGGLEAAGFQGFKYHKEEKEATVFFFICALSDVAKSTSVAGLKKRSDLRRISSRCERAFRTGRHDVQP